MRDLDDKIIYALNISLPTESMKARTNSDPEKNCRELYDTLKTNYNERDRVIQSCIEITVDEVRKLKQERDQNMGDVAIEKKFKSEQRKVSALIQKSVELINRMLIFGC